MENVLSRTAASEAAQEYGWRYILGSLRASTRVGSLAEGAAVAAEAVAACGDGADGHLRVDLRADRVVFTLQSAVHASVTDLDVELARRITGAVKQNGPGPQRSDQVIEIAIDAVDIASIRPFWKAVLAYADEPGHDGPEDPIVDPVGQSPAIWFQQMDKPRPQRNRIHLDISVPHDEAASRMEAALAAGGRLVYDAEAPAFWVLADAEGNEACITTWQGRDG